MSAEWGMLHVGIMASALLVLFGLWGLTQVPQEPVSRTLARLSLVLAVPGAALMLAGIAIDGFATKGVADAWATAPATNRAAVFRVALALEEVQNALFHTWATALFIGLPFLVLGVSSSLAGGWLPTLAGHHCGDRRRRDAHHGRRRLPSRPAPGELFNVFASIVTLWRFIAGLLAWRATGHPAVAGAGATASA